MQCEGSVRVSDEISESFYIRHQVITEAVEVNALFEIIIRFGLIYPHVFLVSCIIHFSDMLSLYVKSNLRLCFRTTVEIITFVFLSSVILQFYA